VVPQHDHSAISCSSPLSYVFVSYSLSLQFEVLEEELLDGKHVVILVELNDSVSNIPTHPLVDSCATRYAVADEELVDDDNLFLFKLKTLQSLEVINSRPVESGAVKDLTKLNVSINGHNEIVYMFITKLCHHLMVQALPWHRHDNVNLSFAKYTVIHCYP